MDPEGIENSSSTSVDFKEGIITEYQTDGAQVSTLIRKYVATDVEMKELYSFFTLDTIEAFETMPEHEKAQFRTGYYDCATLRYFLISEDGLFADGVRHWIYSNDPIDKVCRWIHNIL